MQEIMEEMQNIDGRVIRVIAEQMGIDEAGITRETDLGNDLSVDSLDTIEMIMELEDEFSLTITDEDAEQLQTVGQVIDFIAERANVA